VASKLQFKYKNQQTALEKKMQILGEFDPVEAYLIRLNESFQDACCFYYDQYGGDKIAIQWKFAKNEKFRVHQAFNQTWNDGKVEVNHTGMLQEMQRLGEQLCLGVTIFQ
jgi:hypothetical protein